MSEVSFAKQFLASLDSKPQKLSSDYVADPRKLPAQPAFILPRISHPFPKSANKSTPSTNPSTTAQLNIILAPLRKTTDSPAPVHLAVQAKTSIYDLKSRLGVQTGYLPDKLKILWERKPITDSKTLSEVVGKEDGEVEMAVMYSGAPAAVPQPDVQAPLGTDASKDRTADISSADKMEVDETPVAQGQSGKNVLETDQFWSDLQDFVVQRVRDQVVGKEAVSLWKQAWASS